jgi:hypothetical protein
MADKLDLKRERRGYFTAPQSGWEEAIFPPYTYLMVDGIGAPGGAAYVEALEVLYPVAYGVKFLSKLELGRDYAVPPLEGLWWADDMVAYTDGGRRDEWRWTLLLMLPGEREAAIGWHPSRRRWPRRSPCSILPAYGSTG